MRTGFAVHRQRCPLLAYSVEKLGGSAKASKNQPREFTSDSLQLKKPLETNCFQGNFEVLRVFQRNRLKADFERVQPTVDAALRRFVRRSPPPPP